jgi:hypothetical protein
LSIYIGSDLSQLVPPMRPVKVLQTGKHRLLEQNVISDYAADTYVGFLGKAFVLEKNHLKSLLYSGLHH